MEVRIQMMGAFLVKAGDRIHDNLATRSRKGACLMQYLVLQMGRPVSVQRMARELWGGRRSESPENALKTLVSRTRAMLNEIQPGLGGCIVSVAGGYKWECLPGVEVDVLEIVRILEEIEKSSAAAEKMTLTERLMALYAGDLYPLINDAAQINWLHRKYLEAVYAYAALLKEHEEYNRICEVCQQALRIDEMDEQLHILLMEAMLNLNRASEAMAEYRRVVRQSQRYFDAEPSEEMQLCYKQLAEASRSLKFNLDVIHNELTRQEEEEGQGPYICDYRAFKEIYNIQIRNLERLGSTMFLGVIMIESATSVSREGGMAGLMEILRNNLRRGDIVTRFSENMAAMLLPAVNYRTGNVVIERIEHLFYREYSAENITFHARISPLGGVSLLARPATPA